MCVLSDATQHLSLNIHRLSTRARRSAAATKVCSLLRRKCSVSWPCMEYEENIGCFWKDLPTVALSFFVVVNMVVALEEFEEMSEAPLVHSFWLLEKQGIRSGGCQSYPNSKSPINPLFFPFLSICYPPVIKSPRARFVSPFCHAKKFTDCSRLGSSLSSPAYDFVEGRVNQKAKNVKNQSNHRRKWFENILIQKLFPKTLAPIPEAFWSDSWLTTRGQSGQLRRKSLASANQRSSCVNKSLRLSFERISNGISEVEPGNIYMRKCLTGIMKEFMMCSQILLFNSMFRVHSRSHWANFYSSFSLCLPYCSQVWIFWHSSEKIIVGPTAGTLPSNPFDENFASRDFDDEQTATPAMKAAFK